MQEPILSWALVGVECTRTTFSFSVRRVVFADGQCFSLYKHESNLLIGEKIKVLRNTAAALGVPLMDPTLYEARDRKFGLVLTKSKPNSD